MNEYISREELIKALEADYDRSWCSKPQGVEEYVEGARDEYDDVLKVVCGMKAADVQPINQWISVKDRLPEPEKDVLVWYRYTWGAGFTAYRFGISRWYSNIKRWYEGCLPKDLEVLYWQFLPEPPKDGDTDNNVRNLTDEEIAIYESWIESEAKDTGVNIMDGDAK